MSFLQAHQPALVLAPMEGVTDAPMRAFLTEWGGFTFCVSEFLRISADLPPEKVFIEHVPELRKGCVTPSGTPIQVQLLGGNEEKMALSAARACELGARAIDINFGCPSPTVNRNDGGAALLRCPDRIQSIVAAVRKAVPSEIPVSAKLRLGWENMEDIFVNAEQAALGGASWLTIHARTKMQGYKPPAHWRYIGEVRRRLAGIPIVANGEIWTFEDFLECEAVTGCRHFMIGRGALADPLLTHAIARHLGIPLPESAAKAPPYPIGHDPRVWEPLIKRFSEFSEPMSQRNQYSSRRIKQWIQFAHMKKPVPWFDDIKRTQSLDELFAILRKLC